MLSLLSSLFGAGLTLAAAYGLGSVLLRRLETPAEIRLAVGAVAESLAIFLLLLCHAAMWPVFLALGIGGIAACWWGRAAQPKLPSPPLAAGLIFAAYGFWYFVNTLAPEIQADGITYHLGLVYEYIRLGAFPDHVRFYDVIPQGMEMLFTMAFAFGRHAAAKLVEFVLAAAAIPLIFRTGRKLGMHDAASLLVAVFYWCAPVVGLTAASTYNDAALVFFTLAVFYLLLCWRENGDSRLLLPAGALAGFCYAIKMPGAFVAVGAMLWVALSTKRRVREVVLLATGISIVAGSWIVRAAILTGNPLAPLANAIFPNPYFHLRTEHELAAVMRSLRSTPLAQVPWQLALGDRLTGTFGPLLLILPVGLIALRRREGRLCLAAAAILALPWATNHGARFLMPAAFVAAFAFAMVLPKKIAWAAIALQTVVCCPMLLNLCQPPYTFRLHELPWKAALGIESESQYLQTHAAEYNVARMVEHETPPGAGIFALMPVATAYCARDVSVAWQSSDGDCLTDTLRTAAKYHVDPLFNWTATWPVSNLRAVRFRLPSGFGAEWDVAEVQLFSGGDRVYNSPLWSLTSWPNLWEAPLAFDNRRSTIWRTWQPARAGMFLEVDLDHPQNLSAAVLMSHAASYDVPLEVYGQRGTNGKWVLLDRHLAVSNRPADDLRLEANGVLRRAGYQYLLVPLGNEGNGPLGKQLVDEAPLWGLEIVGDAGPNILFKLH